MLRLGDSPIYILRRHEMYPVSKPHKPADPVSTSHYPSSRSF